MKEKGLKESHYAIMQKWNKHTRIIAFFSQHMPITSQPVFLQYQDYVI